MSELPKDICACGDFRYEHDSITGQCHPCNALGSGTPNAPCSEFRLHIPQTATDGPRIPMPDEAPKCPLCELPRSACTCRPDDVYGPEPNVLTTPAPAEGGAQGIFYGKDCPKGMVQVEFVGCNPSERYSEYGWKPCQQAFIEVYVDGERFRIEVGDFNDGKPRRGLHVIGPIMTVEQTALNAGSMFKSAAPATPAPEVETAPSILEQISDLLAAGWVAEKPTQWRSPDGGLYRGPHGAWKEMRMKEKTPAPEGREPQWRSDDSGYVFEREVLKFIVQTGRNSVKEAARVVALLNKAAQSTPPAQPPVPNPDTESLRLVAHRIHEIGQWEDAAEIRAAADYLDQRQAERPRVTREQATTLWNAPRKSGALFSPGGLDADGFITRLRELGIDVED